MKHSKNIYTIALLVLISSGAIIASRIKQDIAASNTPAEYILMQGVQFMMNSNHSAALQYLQRAYALGKQQNKPHIVVPAALSISTIYKEKKDFDEALVYLSEAYELSKNHPMFSEIKKEKEKLLSLMWIQGATETRNEQYRRAFKLFTKVYENSLNDLANHARAAAGLSFLLSSGLSGEKNIEEAAKLYEIAYKLSRNTPNAYTYVQAANSLGHYYMENKDYTNAIRYFLDAHKANIDEELFYEHAIAAAMIGRIYIALGNHDAKKYLEEAYQLGKQHDYKNIIARAATNLGPLSMEQNDYTKAIEYFLEAYQATDQNTHTMAAGNLGRVYLYLPAVKNFNKAQKYLTEATASNEYVVREIAIYDLYAMKIMLLAQHDYLIALAEDNLHSQSCEDLRALLRRAWKILQDAEQINIPFKGDLDLQLCTMIEDAYNKFHKIESQIRHERERKPQIEQLEEKEEEESIQQQNLEEGANKLNQAENALNSNEPDALGAAKTMLIDFKKMNIDDTALHKRFKELTKRYAELKLSNTKRKLSNEQQKLSSMLTTFDELFASYHAQPNKEIFENAENLLNEITELAARISPETLYQISRKREELYKERKESKTELSSDSESEESEEEEEQKSPIMAHNVKKVKKFLAQQGFELDRTTGRHFHYRHADGRGTTIAAHEVDLSPSSIKKMAQHIKWDAQKLNDALLNMK